MDTNKKENMSEEEKLEAAREVVNVADEIMVILLEKLESAGYDPDHIVGSITPSVLIVMLTKAICSRSVVLCKEIGASLEKTIEFNKDAIRVAHKTIDLFPYDESIKRLYGSRDDDAEDGSDTSEQEHKSCL